MEIDWLMIATLFEFLWWFTLTLGSIVLGFLVVKYLFKI